MDAVGTQLEGECFATKFTVRRFWRLGALRGLLRLGQCLRHVRDTVIDHCTSGAVLRRDLLAAFSATHLFFQGHCFHESARRIVCLHGPLDGAGAELAGELAS